MSDRSKRANSRAAREQAAREALRTQRAKERRRQRTMWTSAVAAAVLLVGGIVGVAVYESSKPANSTVPANATADKAGLVVGSGPVNVEVYFDFMCPYCGQFEQQAGPKLDTYVAEKKITLTYRPIAILDRYSSTEYSTRSASAAGCASDQGKTSEFVAGMMARQPEEGSAGLSDDEIVEIGAAAGLDRQTFGPCVRDGQYRDWAVSSTDAAADRGVTGTPTVFVNGARQADVTLEKLTAAIDQAVP